MPSTRTAELCWTSLPGMSHPRQGSGPNASVCSSRSALHPPEREPRPASLRVRWCLRPPGLSHSFRCRRLRAATPHKPGIFVSSSKPLIKGLHHNPISLLMKAHVMPFAARKVTPAVFTTPRHAPYRRNQPKGLLSAKQPFTNESRASTQDPDPRCWPSS